MRKNKKKQLVPAWMTTNDLMQNEAHQERIRTDAEYAALVMSSPDYRNEAELEAMAKELRGELAGRLEAWRR